MRFIIEFVRGQMKGNRKHVMAIAVSLLVATVFLTALLGIFETFYHYELSRALSRSGNWHLAVKSPVDYAERQRLSLNANVETLMLETIERASVDSKNIDIIVKAYDATYFKEMPVNHLVSEGRMPLSSDEMAIGRDLKSEYRLGDTIVLGNGVSKRVVGFIEELYHDKAQAYVGIGFIDSDYLGPAAVSIKLLKPRSAYDFMDALEVEAVPNTRLLSLYLSFSKTHSDAIDYEALRMPIVFALIIVLVLSIFVYLIKNAYAVGLQSKIQLIGLLRSAGATYRQVKWCYYMEMLLIAALVAPFGVLLGYGLIVLLFNALELIPIVFSVKTVLVTLILAVITCLLSARGPLRQIKNTLVIENLKNGNEQFAQKNRGLRFKSIFTEMGYNAFMYRKKSYRSAIISFTLVLMLLGAMMTVLSANALKNSAVEPAQFLDASYSIRRGVLPDKALIKALREVEGVASMNLYSGYVMTLNGQSFYLVGLEETLFAQNFPEAMAGTGVLLKGQSLGGAYDQALIGDNRVTFKTYDEGTPLSQQLWMVQKYDAVGVVPMSQYGDLIDQLSDENRERAQYLSIDVELTDKSVPAVDAFHEKIWSLLKKTYSENVLEVTFWHSVRESAIQMQAIIRNTLLAITGLVFFVGVINVFTSVLMTFHMRQKEFAAMFSLGMPKREMKRLLFRESLFLASFPIVLSIPFGILFTGLYLKVAQTTWIPYLKSFPYGYGLSVYALVYLCVFLAYQMGYRKISKMNVPATLRQLL